MWVRSNVDGLRPSCWLMRRGMKEQKVRELTRVAKTQALSARGCGPPPDLHPTAALKSPCVSQARCLNSSL